MEFKGFFMSEDLNLIEDFVKEFMQAYVLSAGSSRRKAVRTIVVKLIEEVRNERVGATVEGSEDKT